MHPEGSKCFNPRDSTDSLPEATRPMPQISKDEIVDIFNHIAQLLELKGEVVFKVRAYQNAARALETFRGDLVAMASEGTLGTIEGIGKAIAEKITVLLNTGKLPYYEDLKTEFPPDLFEMFELQGVGPKKIKTLWDKLDITTLAQLEAACKDGRIAGLAGFGKKTADNILLSIESRRKHAGRFRLGDIASDTEKLLEDLRAHPDVSRVGVCGSYRRRKEIVGDVDFLVSTREPKAVSDFFVGNTMVENVLAHGATKSSVRLKSGIQACHFQEIVDDTVQPLGFIRDAFHQFPPRAGANA